jgi:hypothetical protein
MTKFEELQEIIARKKNKDKNSAVVDKEEELAVAGSESTKKPLISCGDEDMDGSIIDDLYRKGRHRPNDGPGAASWDATWD